MKYCVNCGNQLNDADKFCGKCGTAVPVIQAEQTIPPIPPVPSAGAEESDMPPIPKAAEPKSSDASEKNKNVMPAVNEEEHKKEREEELKKNIGTVRKCPYCGFNKVPLFAISCPKCKREFNSTKVDDSVKKFFNEVNGFSVEYRTDEDKAKLGVIGSVKVILICFGALMLLGGNDPKEFNLDSGVPLYIIGIVLVVAGILMKMPVSLDVKRKRNYIETFIIPNNKESIIEFLILAASQIQKGANPFTAEGRRTAFWNKVWKTKIRQTISKANILFTGDEDAQMKVKMIKKQYKIH